MGKQLELISGGHGRPSDAKKQCKRHKLSDEAILAALVALRLDGMRWVGTALLSQKLNYNVVSRRLLPLVEAGLVEYNEALKGYRVAVKE